MTINMGGESFSVAQKEKDDKKNEDPGTANLGLNIRMDGESLSVAQKQRKAYIDENNYLVFTDKPDPVKESRAEKIRKGKAILKQ